MKSCRRGFSSLILKLFTSDSKEKQAGTAAAAPVIWKLNIHTLSAHIKISINKRKKKSLKKIRIGFYMGKQMEIEAHTELLRLLILIVRTGCRDEECFPGM